MTYVAKRQKGRGWQRSRERYRVQKRSKMENTLQYSSMGCAILCNTVQYNSIQFNTEVEQSEQCSLNTAILLECKKPRQGGRYIYVECKKVHSAQRCTYREEEIEGSHASLNLHPSSTNSIIATTVVIIINTATFTIDSHCSSNSFIATVIFTTSAEVMPELVGFSLS